MNLLINVILSIILCALSTGSAVGQWDHLLHKTYPQRFRDIGKIYIRVMDNGDSASVFSEISSLKNYALAHHDSELELESDLLKAYYLSIWHKTQTERIVSMINKLGARAAEQHNMQIGLRSLKVLGDYYWTGARNYELAFEYFIQQENILNKLSTDELPDKVYALLNIAHAYHEFSDYKKASSLFRQILTLKYNPDLHAGHNAALCAIAMIHRQQGNLDSSDHYYRRTIRKESPGNYEVWAAIARGGLGENAYVRGNYTEAVPLLQYNIDHAVSQKDFRRAAEIMIILADIHLKNNEVEKAGKLAETARRYLDLCLPDRYRHFQDLYFILVKVSAARGRVRLAEAYLDSALFVKDSLIHQYNAKLMLRAHQKIELQKLRAQMEKAESDQTQKLIQRNLALILVLIVAAGAAYIYKIQRQRHRQAQQLKELEIRQKKQELENAALQLKEFARNISEKSRQIEALENKQIPDASTLSQLRAGTILTQDDWDYFKKLFSKVHGDYLHRLREKFPELTQGEIRFIALTKLGLGYQEMSATLGISSHAVRTTKYRLLKKIDVPDDRSLEEVMMNI
ncbi:tetratricopeptide repeat protein [Dyadobacter diqingensis]|uniref:tetratricopeptide repeat protein n=1 Tax=Dyadobacter diqingensis TaxID=2938121 RepID=UPI0020C42B48|nr:tetratricopeptide repeat protein [Dyadobacter diqingensis]